MHVGISLWEDLLFIRGTPFYTNADVLDFGLKNFEQKLKEAFIAAKLFVELIKETPAKSF